MSNIVTSRNYLPKSPEEHYAKMQAFMDSMKGLPVGKYSYKHYFSDGVYIRELKLTKGTMIVGARHLKETAMLITKGSLKIFSEKGLGISKAGDIHISPVGTQRAGYALEDSTVVTIHRADTYDLDEMVKQLAVGELDTLSGVNEGDYKLYIRGKKIIDEKIQSNSDKVAIRGRLQRLLPA
jgi:hypothetical protein